MIVIENYLQERVSPNVPGKINAPTFAYICLHGKKPSPSLSGRSAAHPEKIWKGIGVDKKIPTKALNNLDKIKQIELRSSCQGDSDKHPTFLIFRLKNLKTTDTKKLVNKLNKVSDIKCCWGIGNEGEPRIIITSDLWYDKDSKEFIKWWLELPKKISKGVR